MTNEKFLDELKQYGIEAQIIAEVTDGRLVIVAEFQDTEGLDEGEDACEYGEAVEEKCEKKFQFLSAFITEHRAPKAYTECEDAFYAAFPDEDCDWIGANNVYFVPNERVAV